MRGRKGEHGNALLRKLVRNDLGVWSGLRDGSLLFALFAFVLNRETDLAGALSRKGICNCGLKAEGGSAVGHHGQPGDGLANEQVSLDHGEGGQKAKEACQVMHETSLAKQGGLVKGGR